MPANIQKVAFTQRRQKKGIVGASVSAGATCPVSADTEAVMLNFVCLNFFVLLSRF